MEMKVLLSICDEKKTLELRQLSGASMAETYTLRISGLGHNVTLEIPSNASVGLLKEEIGNEFALPPVYQKLITRGVKFDNDELSIAEAGLKDRTKIMLLHNALYAKEKVGFESLSALDKEIDDLISKGYATESRVISELITRICCKLDEVDTAGSENLRSMRKDLIKKAESIDATTKSKNDAG